MSGVQTLRIGDDDGDQRLDRFLRKRFPQLTQGRIEKMCRKGEIRIDEAVIQCAGLRGLSGCRGELQAKLDEAVEQLKAELTQGLRAP